MDQKIVKVYCNFQRPPGPINVWKVVKGLMNGKTVKFSIQEIPEDRYDAVVDHMCSDFIRDEQFYSNFKIQDYPDSYQEARIMWKEILKCGMSIAAFVDNPEGGQPLIAGANVLYVSCKEDRPLLTKISEAFKAKNLSMLVKLVEEIASESCMDKVYGVDKYLIGWGLSVDRNFRGMSLGGHILSARNSLGQKYGIPVSVTLFTAPAAIKLAEQEGYECLLEKNVNEFVNEKGELLFHNSTSKCFKFMGKRL